MRGIRDKVTITYATPLDGAFTKPTCTKVLSHLFDEKHITIETEFNAGRVDGEAGILASWDEREIPFDILVSIPLHQGAEFVKKTPGLGDDYAFVRTNPRTLQSELKPNIFALGDAANLPASKAGSVAHFEAEVLEENIVRFLAGEDVQPEFDGHANCFIETGFEKALLIDFNYDTEPLPGIVPAAGHRADVAARGVAPEPLRQDGVQVGLLERAAARPRHPDGRPADVHARQAPDRDGSARACEC